MSTEKTSGRGKNMAKETLVELAVAIEKIDALEKKVDSVQEAIKETNTKLDNKYVTIEEFRLVRNIVYGLVAMILTTVFAAILKLVIFQ